MRIARFAIALLVSALLATASACEGPGDGAANTDASAVPTTSSAPTTTISSQGDTTPTTSSRDCPLPMGLERPPFVDVTGSDDQPDSDEVRTMRAFGSEPEYLDGYRVTVVRLISDDAEKPLPPIDEEGLRSEEWWDSVDHDVFVRIAEEGLGEAGVDFCVWYLKSQVDYDTTLSEITAGA